MQARSPQLLLNAAVSSTAQERSCHVVVRSEEEGATALTAFPSAISWRHIRQFSVRALLLHGREGACSPASLQIALLAFSAAVLCNLPTVAAFAEYLFN